MFINQQQSLWTDPEHISQPFFYFIVKKYIQRFAVLIFRIYALEYTRNDASTKRPQPVFILSIKSSLNDFIPNK